MTIEFEHINRTIFSEQDRNEVHDDAIRAAELNPDFLLERYCAMPRSHGGRYVSADLFKELFPKFSASPEGRNRYNNPVHNAAAVLASAQFQMNLDAVPAKNCTSVIMLTGIPGAGKTSFVFTNGRLDDGLRMVYEGQLSNPVTSIKKIGQALDANLDVQIIVVHTLPEKAFENTVQRFMTEGRGAGIDVMARIQGGIPKCLEEVRQRFGDHVKDGSLDLMVIDRRKSFRHPEFLDGWKYQDVLKSEGNYDEIKIRLQREVKRLQASGQLTSACFRQATGLAPLWGPVSQVREGSKGCPPAAIEEGGSVFRPKGNEGLGGAVEERPGGAGRGNTAASLSPASDGSNVALRSSTEALAQRLTSSFLGIKPHQSTGPKIKP